MDNNELFRELAKHYKFSEKDWWQHRQSGNWILAHSAVLKMSCVPTPEGNTILLPSMEEYNWIKTGEEGVFGREVLVGGTFKLISPDGETIRTVVAWGEANPLNVNKGVSYPNIMAVKRMIDRGVLGVLAYNQLNIYSAVEAETFSDPKQKVQPKSEPKPESVLKVGDVHTRPSRPVPQRPATKPPVPQSPQKKTEPVSDGNHMESIRNLIVGCLAQANGELLPRTTITDRTGISVEDTVAGIKSLRIDGLIVKEGERRGSKYKVPSSQASLTEEQFSEIWKDACSRMSQMGVSYKEIAGFTREVTGHDTGVAAFNAGKLSMDKIETIFIMGQDWAASHRDAV
jgi:biotin operon repressor